MGLWLRFDSRTAGLFEGTDSPTVFFTGEKQCYFRAAHRRAKVCILTFPSVAIRADTGMYLLFTGAIT